MIEEDQLLGNAQHDLFQKGTIMSLKKLLMPILAVALSASAVVVALPAASAHTGAERPAYFPNGVRIDASEWITSFTWSGCGSFTSSATIGATPQWIQDVVAFHANGIGASVYGLSMSGSGSDASLSWRNSNGARGAYLSGSVCMNWLTWYLSMTSSGTALYDGTTRTAISSL